MIQGFQQGFARRLKSLFLDAWVWRGGVEPITADEGWKAPPRSAGFAVTREAGFDAPPRLQGWKARG